MNTKETLWYVLLNIKKQWMKKTCVKQKEDGFSTWHWNLIGTDGQARPIYHGCKCVWQRNITRPISDTMQQLPTIMFERASCERGHSGGGGSWSRIELVRNWRHENSYRGRGNYSSSQLLLLPRQHNSAIEKCVLKYSGHLLNTSLIKSNNVISKNV